MSTTARRELCLRWSEKDSQTLVEPRDEDRFFMTVEEVIEACRIYDKAKRASFQVQLRNLLVRLGQWVHEHRNDIAHAFLTVQNSQLLFLIVTKGRAYDASLEQSLTDLDVSVAEDEAFSDVRLSVQSLPHCSEQGYASFCDPQVTIEYRDVDA